MATDPHERTEGLDLFRWTSDYLEEFATMLADPVVMEHISKGRPLSLDEAAAISARSEELWSEFGIGPWAAFDRASGGWVGRIGMNLLAGWPGPDKWEVGFELVQSFWGQGLAAEGARAALSLGFGDRGLNRVISVTAADNYRSRRVMEKVGLAFAGSMLWRDTDVVWYQVDRPASRP